MADRNSYRPLTSGSSCEIGDVRAVSITTSTFVARVPTPAWMPGCKELDWGQSPYWKGSSFSRSAAAGVCGSIDGYRINNE